MNEERSRTGILLVEDDTITALVVSRALVSHGYSVRRVATGEEAVAAFGAGEAFDLALVNLDLGTGIDGVETARRILALKTLPLIFLSCSEPGEMAARAEGLGRHGYVRKGTDDRDLLDAVDLELEIQEATSLFSGLIRSIYRIERLARTGTVCLLP